MNNTTDVLTASSTLITVIAILYSLWYYDIDKYSRKELPKHEADRTTIRLTIKSILISKLIPLMLINTFFILLFSYRVINYVLNQYLYFFRFPCSFYPIIVSIIFISILSHILVIILANKAIILVKKYLKRRLTSASTRLPFVMQFALSPRWQTARQSFAFAQERLRRSTYVRLMDAVEDTRSGRLLAPTS
jgi:hypothetical protein